jgi:hypothetical protein
MDVRVSGCKCGLADGITDPQGDTGCCIRKDEIKVLGPIEEEIRIFTIDILSVQRWA